MIIELAMAGMLACDIRHQKIIEDDILCFYQCRDTTREFARTGKEYQCPQKLYVDRKPLPFKDRDYKGNRWTKEQIEKFEE
jgi:hypothetical protein